MNRTPDLHAKTAMPPAPYAPVASRFFVLGLLILTAVGAIADRAIERLRADVAAVTYSEDVLTTLTGIESEVAKANSARRGFLIARDSSFINEFVASRGDAENLLDDLDSLTQDSPEQRRRATKLRRAAREGLALMQASTEVATRVSVADNVLLPTDGSAPTLRSALYGLMAEERRILVERENRAETTQLAADFALAGGFALAFGLFYLASRRSARAAMEREDANRLLAERAVELGVANRQLEELLLATSQRLHEPLREIEVYAVGVASTASANDDMTAGLGRAATAMRRMVDDLRVYAQLSSYEPARERVPLDPLLDAMVKRLQPSIASSDATVTVDRDLPTVLGDTTLIDWIVSQLVDNALTFHQAGSPPEVHIGGARIGDRVRVSVSDRGPGILRDNQARIFHLFERLDRTDVRGNGIGLAIAQRAAELMGTRVRIESELGEGSTFSVDLPPAHAIS
jgi:signal transduction histidine kinase